MWISAVSARLEGWQVLSERAKRELVHDSQTRLSDVLDGRHRGADRFEPRFLIRRRGEIALAASDATDDEFEASVIAQLEAEHAMLAPCTDVDLFRPCSA